MPAAPAGPLDRDTEHEVLQVLERVIVRPVGLDVWTRQESSLLVPGRDPCTHCDETLAMMRQLVTLHPAITVTPYDLDRHASRASEAGVDMAPTVIARSGGRSIHLVGMCSGLLFAAMLDVLGYLSSGETPLEPSTLNELDMLPAPVHLELAVTPYDPYSTHMVRLTAAFATASRRVRLRVIEVSQFPLAAERRSITEVPVLSIDGKRFVGAWEEDALLDQIERVVGRNDMPVIRDQIYSTPFITEEEARRLGSEAAPQLPDAPESGLYVPGR